MVGHGQMAPTQLEEVMSAFYDGQYDVLLSTTIVESGLDIPTANTLIIHRADMFGLSQLYQLRGRVGRAKSRAYAYMTTPAEKQITLSAERRLKVLQSLDSLGAGFQLASHDLGHPWRRQSAGRGAVRPHPRDRGGTLPADAGGRGQRAEDPRRRRGARQRPGLVAADQHRRGRADPGRVCAGPERAPVALPPPVGRREGAGPRGAGRRADRPVRAPAARGRPAAEGRGDQGALP